MDYSTVTTDDVKPIREAMGLTQRKFAERINVTVVTVSLWETRKGMRIHPGNAEKILKLKKKYLK